MTEWRRLRRSATQPQADRDLTDASPAAEPSRRAEVSPELRRRLKRRRRTLVLGLVGICLAGSLATLFGERGYLDVRRYRAEIRSIEERIEQRRREVDALRMKKRRIASDSSARERVAREELGMLAPGEIEFLLPRSSVAPWKQERGRSVP